MEHPNKMKRELCNSVEGGLWGCIVVASAFLIQVMAFGTSESIGVYNIEFLRYFDAGAAAVSLVGSINLGVFLGAGPLASMLMTRWSHRQVALLGACLCNAGLIVMPFAPNLEYMYAFYGVLTGLGYCFVYVPSHVLSGLYFMKHRSLATGVATAGSGMGAAVFPIILYHIIDYYGWRGSLFIVAGLNLQLFVFVGLLRPVPKYLSKRLSLLEKSQNSSRNESGRRMSHENGFLSSQKKKEKLEDGQQSSTTLSPRSSQGTNSRLKQHFSTVFTIDFIIFWVSNVGWNAGGAIMLIFFPEYTYSVGLSKENVSTTFTMTGLGTCIGCILGGLLGNIRCINRIGLYILGNLGAALATLILPWKMVHNFEGLLMVALVFGLMFGIILGLLVVVTSDLLGTEALSDGFGYLMLANGIGVLSGPPIAGLLIDSYGSKDPGIYLAGIVTAMGGLVMMLVAVRRKLCHTAPVIHEEIIIVNLLE